LFLPLYDIIVVSRDITLLLITAAPGEKEAQEVAHFTTRDGGSVDLSIMIIRGVLGYLSNIL
jgi:hypothetical protein